MTEMCWLLQYILVYYSIPLLYRFRLISQKAVGAQMYCMGGYLSHFRFVQHTLLPDTNMNAPNHLYYSST